MPTSPLMKLPKTKIWQEFEYIAKDAFSVYSNQYGFQLYGRRGQKQNGIDIYCRVSLNGFIGVQCKNFLGIKDVDEFSKEIDKEISNAEIGEITILEYIVITALDTDVNIQNFIEKKSDERISNGKFSIKVMFWDDIEEIICSNSYLFAKYYPVLYKIQSNMNILTSLLILAFIGSQISNLVNLMLGDRMETAKYCELLQNGAMWIKNKETQQRFVENLSCLRECVDGDLEYNNSFFTSPLNTYCKEIENCIDTLIGTLNDIEKPYYFAGKILASWSKALDCNMNYVISKAQIDIFINTISDLPLNPVVYNQIVEKLNSTNINDKLDDFDSRKYKLPFLLYDFLIVNL